MNAARSLQPLVQGGYLSTDPRLLRPNKPWKCENGHTTTWWTRCAWCGVRNPDYCPPAVAPQEQPQ